jgi:Tetratricopeptide repeat
MNLAVLYSDADRFSEAESADNEAVTIYRDLTAENQAYQSDMSAAIDNLGLDYGHAGRFREAESAYKESLAIWRGLICSMTARPAAFSCFRETAPRPRNSAQDARTGSGNRWRYGAKSTTDDYRTLDVRRWAREGVLRPGYRGGWQWTRDGETVASIQMRSEHDRVILIYRHRSGGGEWKDEQCPVRIMRAPCNLGGTRPWFLCPAVGCGRRVAILYGAGSSPVGTAISSPTPVHARMRVDVLQDGLTGFGRGWAGSRTY